MDYPLFVGKKYKLEKRLGTGTFGEVFKCTSLENHKPYAIKLEKSSLQNPQLLNEAKKYQYLLRGHSASEVGIPQAHYFCKEGNFNMLVMDLLGPSLEDLIGKAPGGKFSLSTVLKITHQLLNRLEYIHKKHFLHRDLKPDNFLLGDQSTENAGKLFLIDFGLSKPYTDRSGLHIPMRTGKQLVGTARYAAIPTHIGVEYGRRDDLESLAHILIYFLKGSLPWQNLPANTKEEKFQKIMEKKQDYPIEDLCEGIPVEFESLLRYARGLQFTDQIDYGYLNGMFNSLALKLGINLDKPISIDEMRGKQPIQICQKRENNGCDEEFGVFSRPTVNLGNQQNDLYQHSRSNLNSGKIVNKSNMNGTLFETKANTSAFNCEEQNANNNIPMQNLNNNYSMLNQNQFNSNNQNYNQRQFGLYNTKYSSRKYDSSLLQFSDKLDTINRDRQILQQKEFNAFSNFDNYINQIQFK